MPQTILTPPPLTEMLANKYGFGNRPWTTWFSSLYKKLGGAGNVGNFYLQTIIDDISVNSSVYVPVPINSYLVQVWCINATTTTFSDETIDILNDAGSTIATITVPLGSPPGTVSTATLSSSNSFSKGDTLKLISTGASTTASVGAFTMAFTH